MNTIDRSNVNDSKVKAQDFPKSGFDLSYKSRMDFILGRLIPSGFQHIMPADKFSGSTDVKYTFNTLQVPEISDVEVSQHNFYVPYRAIDKTFIDGIVPTELNAMSASWHTPTFNLKGIIELLENGDLPVIYDSDSDQGLEYTLGDYFKALQTLSSGQYVETFGSNTPKILADTWISSIKSFANPDDFYNADFLDDYHEFILSVLKTIDPNTQGQAVFYYLFLTAFLEPLFGRGSLLDLLGYQYLRSYDLNKIAEDVASAISVGDPVISFYGLVDDTLEQNEYALRAYYAIWFEWYRDKNLEKRSANLPDWRNFGSSSILTSLHLWCFLPLRIRSWQKDMFVGSMPDDISRHVYAPILSNEGDTRSIKYSTSISDYKYAENDLLANQPDQDTQGYVNMRSMKLYYTDPNSGSEIGITCPVPSAVNDSLIGLSTTYTDNPYVLDLRDLRKSQMLERYLKRNFYFGDEYQDRMLAHYGSKVSDNSIRRPHLLSSSVSSVNPRQEIANMSNEVTKAGTRTATAQDSAHGDAFEFFAEEFGIVINILSIRPIAQYQGLCPQNLLYKQTDFPLPEFANNNDEFGRVLEIACSGYNNSTGNPQIYQFGHYPYAHAYRSRVDEVHGSFVDDKIDYTFARFFGNQDVNEVPKLNYRFIHCRPRLGMFYDTIRLSGQGYMTCDHHFYVERVLPTPVEEI